MAEKVRQRVLILCTGNRAARRSPRVVNDLLGSRWEAHSAGTSPAAAAHPLAVRAMGEVGIDISAGRPTHVKRYLAEPWDLVVTVCDSARESCPVFPRPVEQIHVRSWTQLSPRAARTSAWPPSAPCGTTSRHACCLCSGGEGRDRAPAASDDGKRSIGAAAPAFEGGIQRRPHHLPPFAPDERCEHDGWAPSSHQSAGQARNRRLPVSRTQESFMHARLHAASLASAGCPGPGPRAASPSRGRT